MIPLCVGDGAVGAPVVVAVAVVVVGAAVGVLEMPTQT